MVGKNLRYTVVAETVSPLMGGILGWAGLMTIVVVAIAAVLISKRRSIPASDVEQATIETSTSVNSNNVIITENVPHVHVHGTASNC